MCCRRNLFQPLLKTNSLKEKKLPTKSRWVTSHDRRATFPCVCPETICLYKAVAPCSYLTMLLSHALAAGCSHVPDRSTSGPMSFGDQSFRVVGPRLWNTLPIDIVCCRTLSAFRKALKTHIFKAYYCQLLKYSMTFWNLF